MSKIESNIPVAPKSCRKWPFKEMKVGDSVLFKHSGLQQVWPYAAYYQKRYGMKFTGRLVKGGTRMWRIK